MTYYPRLPQSRMTNQLEQRSASREAGLFSALQEKFDGVSRTGGVALHRRSRDHRGTASPPSAVMGALTANRSQRPRSTAKAEEFVEKAVASEHSANPLPAGSGT